MKLTISRNFAYIITGTSLLLALASSPLSALADAGIAIQSITPGTTVSVGTPFSFMVATIGFNGGTLTYTLTDTLSGSTASSSAINPTGKFSWTPATVDTGIHNITVKVTDSSGNISQAAQQITVGSSNSSSGTITSNGSLTVKNVSPGATVPVGTQVTFSISTNGLSNPTYTLSDAYFGTTITNGNINSSGNFAWTPVSSDIGTHIITIRATEASGNNVATTQGISVAPAGTVVPTTTTPAPAVTQTVTTPPAVSSYNFTEYLSEGASSQAVSELQKILSAQGLFSGPISGYFGALTKAALQQFQTAHGLTALGVVGPATRAILNTLSGVVSSVVTAVSSGSSANLSAIKQQILLIQQQLVALQTQLNQLLSALGQ